jgi:Rho termination factor, N-terminal domain
MQRRDIAALAVGFLIVSAGALLWRFGLRRLPENGGGEPPAGDLDQLTVVQLRELARQLDIPGRSGMRKHDLVSAIGEASRARS